MTRVARRIATLAMPILCVGCAAWSPLRDAPPSPDRPWAPPELAQHAADLVARQQLAPAEPVEIDPAKTYDLPELVDIAQRVHPATRVAWERARQAAIAVGMAAGTYYPLLAVSATGGAARVAAPFPPNLIPGGLPDGYLTAKTQAVLPIVSLEWLLLDFGRRGAAVDAARALALEATIGFNAEHQQIVFAVTRAFYALTAVRGKVAAARAALASAQTLERAAEAHRARGEGTLPEALQAHEEAVRAQYEVDDALAAEIDARMALAESMGVAPTTAIRVVDLSTQPLPPGVAESVDDAVDRALAQRPDLLASLAALQAKEAEVRGARADFFPKLGVRAATGRNLGRVSVLGGPYDTVDAQQWDAGLRLEWTLFEGFERRNRLSLAESARRAAADELTLARDKAVREVWKAYQEVKVAIARQQAGAALLAASEKSWSAVLSSYDHGLATYPDLREADRNLARARMLDTQARAQVFTAAAALAFSTGDLARPVPTAGR
ncbi:MAG: TolC family protein [bacterium]|nr:TolC family protein [bacterium]